MTAKERMDWLVNFLTIRFGFVHRILGLTNKIADPGIKTMSVKVLGNSKFELRYNPQFILDETDEHLTYILFHEAMHLVLHHCTSRKKCSNEACDLAVNELIPIVPGRCERPPYGLFVSEMRKNHPDIKEKQTAEWYDGLLKTAVGTGDRKSKNQSGKGDDDILDDHDGWAEDEMADEVIRAKVREIDLSDGWGNVSGTFKELVRAAQVKRINWRNHIRRFGGNLMWKHKEMTLKRPNRRTGLLHPGYKRQHTDKLLVCLDNSMSTHSLVPQFLGVINGMTDYMPIDIVQFDAGITYGPKPFRKKTNHECKGQGGTNFQPVIDLMNKNRYRGAVILTDGEAAVCTRPDITRVMWVLPKDKKPPVEWGKRIHLDPYI